MTQTRIAIGGFSSEVGKTTLMTNLLRAFPGWEAIKLTRGHYRSCGKDPHACCVSHLLSDHPVVRSGRAQTYAPGKDTGRYWDAGASNVHWVIVTDAQVENGIRLALERVCAPGVFIEGNSFLKYIDVHYAIMVARARGERIKATARRALPRCDALYLFENDGSAVEVVAGEDPANWPEVAAAAGVGALVDKLPRFTRRELPQLIAHLQAVHDGRAG